MKWRNRRGSRNIEDRRGRRSAGTTGAIGGVGLLIVLAIGFFLGVDVTPFLQGGNQVQTTQTSAPSQADDEAGQFVSVVLADTEEIWSEIFPQQIGRNYTPPKLVLFNTVTQSPCGSASGATGPFYCPADRKAYLDTSFFSTLARRMGAKGDFAAAYVVAHEVAHHVQNEMGVLSQANQARSRMSQNDSNRVSVMIELQADCFSGIWARAAQEKFGSLEEGDLREAMNAARQIGDDTLQRNAGRRPMPHTFTHGTSEQRMRWFARGYETGQLAQCDTFAARAL
jgi:predicted metalloprotease